MPQLTAERREELLALLDDQERLRAEYPAVAEYLEVSPALTGTGDDVADAAFELRLLHFMTAGTSVSDPYWEIVGPLVQAQDGRRVLAPTGGSRLAYAQTVLHQAYAYAVPSPETVGWVREVVAGRKLVEPGAGRGYWASRLNSAGIDVVAFDAQPPNSEPNPSFPRAGTRPLATWYEVQHARSLLEVKADNSGSVMFLCWPPGWEDPMASDVLAEFEDSDGECLVYIGEPPGGKTGNSAFFSALAARWKLESVDSQYVSWWNLNDYAQAWVRT
ncbi:hypothetical protein E9998_06630 [Glycomyces paridis]|uniref:Uncharacterized protein n=1 Tax=Glycomyces paridis TaxID=2126555 RepID=A0A4S8PN26_9ACTN|nr:hypothetical protein E9998_06630 [Glycomyces paridis]